MCPECGITAFTTDARQPGPTSKSDRATQFADSVFKHGRCVPQQFMVCMKNVTRKEVGTAAQKRVLNVLSR